MSENRPDARQDTNSAVRHEARLMLDTICEKSTELAHDVGSVTARLRTYKLIRKILIGFILVSVANVVFSYFFFTPKIYRIYRDNRELITDYRILQERIRTAQSRIDNIRQRDNFVYRTLFATDTLSIAGVWQPYAESKYASMAGDEFAPLMTDTWKQLDRLARTLYLESVSMDELQRLSHNKEQLSAAIPAIWPIDRKKLRNNHIGAFNMRRLHPTLGIIRPHKGVDLAGTTGDPVFATGDAVVESTSSMRGYGKQVLLNHEFGYKTRYAHLSKVLVRPGDKIKRGQLIALVGNTGISSGPHLHYEVIHKGHHVNPINYFNRNMTPEEYDNLMKQMKDITYEKF